MPAAKSVFFTVAVALFSGLASCAPAPQSAPDGPSGLSTQDLFRMISAPVPPIASAREEFDFADAASTAAQAAQSRYEGRRGVRRLEISAIPYLRSSPPGAAFLSSPFPRAIARGAPASMCPATGLSTSGGGGAVPLPVLKSVVSDALSSCVAELARRGAPPSCECRVLAVNDVLLAPQDEFIYATSVSAFLSKRGESGTRVVAEAIRPRPGDSPLEQKVMLRDLTGEVARLILRGDEAALLFTGEGEIADGEPLLGVRTPFGYRRGRLAERVVFDSGPEAPATLLIGVEARDVAAN